MSASSRTGHGWKRMALLGALLIAGCGPGFGPAGVEFVVRAPPRERVEVRGVAPGPGYFWINGNYAWRGGDYVWVSGRWDRPPQATFRRWEAGHWAHARQGWYWVEGRWR